VIVITVAGARENKTTRKMRRRSELIGEGEGEGVRPPILNRSIIIGTGEV